MYSRKLSSLLLLAAALAACADHDPMMPLTQAPSVQATTTSSGQWALSASDGAYAFHPIAITTIADNFSVTSRFKVLDAEPRSLVENRGLDGETGWSITLEPVGGTHHLAIAGVHRVVTSLAIEAGVWHELEVGRRGGSWYAVLNGIEHDLGNDVLARPLPDVTVGYFYSTSYNDYITVRDLAQNTVIEDFQMEEGTGETTTGARGRVLEISSMAWVGNYSSPRVRGKAIRACGTIIASGGRYTLAADLVNCASHGIDIRANDVTIDLNGHVIDGVGSFAAIAAGMGVPGGVRGLNITGPGELRQFGAGVMFEGVADSRVYNATMDRNTFGFALNAGFTASEPDHHSSGNLLRGNHVVFNSTHGVALNGATGNNISGNVIKWNFGSGILLYNAIGNTVKSNEVIGSFSSNIRAVAAGASGNVIMDNVTRHGWPYDLEDQNGHCTANTWMRNTFVRSNPACIQ